MTLREWRNTRAADILWKFQLTKWINSDDMTEEEKAQRPSHETTGGYLKTFTYHEAWTNLWTTLDDKEKEVVKAIPNFDPAKFLHITGIDVTKED